MKSNFLLFLIMVSSLSIRAQSDSISDNNYIYDGVYKNIAAYYIHVKLSSQKGLDERGYLRYGGGKDLFGYILPNLGYQLDLKIQKLDYIYPRKGYVMYAISLPKLGFRPISRSFSQKKYFFGMVDGNDGLPGENYLVALGSSGEIIFISGQFFVQDISGDFALNPKDPVSYLDYLKYKTFAVKNSEIKFLKSTGRKLYFTGYSNVYKKKVLISIMKKKPWVLKMSSEE